MTLSALGSYGGIDKHDVYMPLTPMFHVNAWGVPYLTTLYGLKQVYPGKYEPEMLIRLILGEKVTLSHCVPTILQMLVAAPAVKQFDLSRWKVVIGGARLTKGLAMAARELGVKVYAGYGMSETCPILTIADLKPFVEKEWDEEKQLDWAIVPGPPTRGRRCPAPARLMAVVGRLVGRSGRFGRPPEPAGHLGWVMDDANVDRGGESGAASAVS